MNKSLKMILVLTIITVISGVILSYWDSFTKPKIEAHRANKMDKLVRAILPDNDSIEELKIGGKTIYKGIKDDEIIGLVFKVEGGGYQDIISIIVGVSPDFSEINAIKILSQKETPGLGTKIVDDPSNDNPAWFTEQFKNLKIEPEIIFVKGKEATKNNEIQAITGATISSKAVVNILNVGIANIKKMYENKK
ncbi:MAG: FMN-binding protein [Candidatus Marinimicrobia bacterium]|nr:FMN-binding protein [Candidatus Neomarinimicrobiota bacterium]